MNTKRNHKLLQLISLGLVLVLLLCDLPTPVSATPSPPSDYSNTCYINIEEQRSMFSYFPDVKKITSIWIRDTSIASVDKNWVITGKKNGITDFTMNTGSKKIKGYIQVDPDYTYEFLNEKLYKSGAFADDKSCAKWDGTLSLSSLGITIPKLEKFNSEGLLHPWSYFTGYNNGKEGSAGYESYETLTKSIETLNTALKKKGFTGGFRLDTNDIGIILDLEYPDPTNSNIGWIFKLELEREGDGYTFIIPHEYYRSNCSNAFGTTPPHAKYIPDLYIAMLSFISPDPEALYNQMLKDISKGSLYTTWKQAGGCNLIMPYYAADHEKQLSGSAYACFYISSNANEINIAKSMDCFAGECARLYTHGNFARASYKSSNPSVVSVNKNGMLYCKKSGKATITVKVGNVTKKCVVTVKPIQLQEKNLIVYNGNKTTLHLLNACYGINKTAIKSITDSKNILRIVYNKAGASSIGNTADDFSSYKAIPIQIIATKTGTTTMTIKLYNGKTLKIKVKVAQCAHKHKTYKSTSDGHSVTCADCGQLIKQHEDHSYEGVMQDGAINMVCTKCGNTIYSGYNGMNFSAISSDKKDMYSNQYSGCIYSFRYEEDLVELMLPSLYISNYYAIYNGDVPNPYDFTLTLKYSKHMDKSKLKLVPQTNSGLTVTMDASVTNAKIKSGIVDSETVTIHASKTGEYTVDIVYDGFTFAQLTIEVVDSSCLEEEEEESDILDYDDYSDYFDENYE